MLGFDPVSVTLHVQDKVVQQKQLLLNADFSVFCYETWGCYEVTGVQGAIEIVFKLGVEKCGKGQGWFQKCTAFRLDQKHSAMDSTASPNVCILK